MFENRIRAFTGPGAEQRATCVGHFFKAMAGKDVSRDWCIANGIGLVKATVETTGTFGGFLAPHEFDSAIIAVRERAGAYRQGAEVRPIKSVSNFRPRRSGGVTASFVAEGAVIPESNFSLDAVQASMKKLAVLARGSSELFDDEAADLGEFLTSEIAYSMAATEDDCGFNGDGTSTYSGISGLSAKLTGTRSAIAAASTHNTFLTIDATDLANLVGGVMASALPGAAWYCSQLAFAQTFCRIANTAGGGHLHSEVLDGERTHFFNGFPIRMSAKLPALTTSLAGKPMMFFGDLSKSSVLIERSNQTVLATSLERAMDSDQVLVRGVVREDLINHMGLADITNTPAPVAMLLGTT